MIPEGGRIYAARLVCGPAELDHLGGGGLELGGAQFPGQAAEQALTDLKTSLAREADDFKIVGEKPLTYRNGNLSLSGRQIVVTYSYSGERYRRWALVLPRPTGTVAHIWSYTAPDSLFVEFRPFADSMLKSWIIQPGGG